MSAYVLDASVAAKWLLPSDRETFVPEALQILSDYADGKTDLVVPDLFWPEIGNILSKAIRFGRIQPDAADKALSSIAGLGITTSPSFPLLFDAFAIATSTQTTINDCLYVALSISTRKPLLTADEKLVYELGARFPVRWIGSLLL
jgi:predicted nucleic acid-binding protein